MVSSVHQQGMNKDLNVSFEAYLQIEGINGEMPPRNFMKPVAAVSISNRYQCMYFVPVTQK
jgi:hypothetical protein